MAMLSDEVPDFCSSRVEGLARSHQGACVSVCSLMALCLGMKGVSERPTASCGCSGVIESVEVGLRDRTSRHHVRLLENDEGTAKTTTMRTTTITTITTTLRTFSGDAVTYKATFMVAMPSWPLPACEHARPLSYAVHPRDLHQQTPKHARTHAQTYQHTDIDINTSNNGYMNMILLQALAKSQCNDEKSVYCNCNGFQKFVVSPALQGVGHCSTATTTVTAGRGHTSGQVGTLAVL
jgi:hypothetical protein